MKKVFIGVCFALLCACTSKNELTNQGAQEAIEKDLSSKAANVIPIYTADPKEVGKLEGKKLLSSGLVYKIPGLGNFEVGKPLVSFNAEALKYEMPVIKANDSTIRYFRAGEIKVENVKILSQEDGQAQVSYDWKYTKPTPFAELIDIQQTYSSKASLRENAGKWEVR